MRRFFRSVGISLMAFAVIPASSYAGTKAKDPAAELRKIDALLETVKTADVTFIRNGSDYTAQEGYEHLRKKLKAAQNSWFAPPKDEWTARLFIEKVASRSTLSGKPYQVRFKDGKVLETRVWLGEKLRAMEASPTR